MEARLPIGIDDFKKLIEGNYQFADKSLFIKDVMQDGAEVIVITRPRRFGKTLNLSMLYYFLQLSPHQDQNLFELLNISEHKEFCQKHQQQYPVIFVSFKDIKKTSFDAALDDIVELIRNLYGEHRYLLEGDSLYEDEKAIFIALLDKKGGQSDVESAIAQLSMYMERKFNKKPIILIDEYDTPIQESYMQGYYSEMINLMRSILGKALKGNKNLYKAIITGITRVSQESLFSGVNNIEVYSLLREEYGQYFGFTEPEVIKLIAETGKEVSLEKIREWYNGYKVGKYTLYNPWSIIKCLKNHGSLEPYWVNTASNDLISTLLKNSKIAVKQQFEELLQGNTIEQPISENLVFAEIETQEDALWSLLLYAGYLKVLSRELLDYQLMAKLAIPNKEVGFVYDKIVRGWFSKAVDFQSYNDFIQSLASGDLEKFKIYLSNYIMQTGSYFDFNSNTPEQIFHVFILGLVLGLRDIYEIHSNKEFGLGRCDVVFIPKDKSANGIILEFKTSSSSNLLLDKAKEGLAQIRDNKYIQIFKSHNIQSIIAIGIAFFGKEVEMVWENTRVI